MCKVKNNTEKIGKYQRGINIRFDYYSVPGSVTKVVGILAPGTNYENRKPTEEKMQIVDYDSVASSMDMTITELLFHAVHIMTCDGGRYTIFVHRNYVSVDFRTEGMDGNAAIIKGAAKILYHFLGEGEEGFNIQDVCCRVNLFTPEISNDTIWTVLDQSAFPVMEGSKVVNGNYVDTYEVENYYIDLLRNIRPSAAEKNDVVVSTTAMCDYEKLAAMIAEQGLEGVLKDMLDKSVNEITRCYTA